MTERRRRPIAELGLSGGIVGLASIAHAEPRPPEGGPFGFDPTDVLESWDEPRGRVRVHFSVEGPNATPLEDLDADLVPDYPQRVARITALALADFEDRGFRAPTPEFTTGDAVGGTEALDVYLVDFGGAGDGRFGIDQCDPTSGHCAGFLVVENDFAGYGYPSLDEATSTVASHEAFHAIQAAYAELPVWMSEGTATWATHRYDDTLSDFTRACSGYLSTPGRPIDQPPPGPVPAFAYGSALWWEFISTRNDDDLIVELLVAMDDADGAIPPSRVMSIVLDDFDDPLPQPWISFARHNLAAGFRAGGSTSHSYAGQLEPIAASAEGPALDLSARLFPLAAEYWRVDHPGGPLWFGADAPLRDVTFSLHPVAEFQSDGVVGDPISEWDAPTAGSRSVFDADLPPGGYWIVATLAVIAEQSAKARVCIGSPSHLEACDIEPIEPPGGQATGTSGETRGGLDDGASDASGDTSSHPSGDESTGPGGGAAVDDSGCRCGPSRRSLRRPWFVLGLAFARRRRRRGPR